MAEQALRHENEALVENPLRNLDGWALVQDVERFAKVIGFEGIKLEQLKRGAFIAKYPNIADAVARQRIAPETAKIELSNEERIAIQNEKEALFKQSQGMWLTVTVCAVAALVQGWDQTGSNGANLYWPKLLHVEAFGNGTPSHAWIVGLVNAAPYISASLCGCLLVDPLNHYFGRRGTIFFAALWCFASVVGSAFTQHWWTLFVSRLCLGIGMGAKASTVPIFAAESAPAYFRGSIVMCWQLWVASGILLGFSANLVVSTVHQEDLAWRLMLGSALIPAIPLLILVYVAPESPRWYMKQGTADGYRRAFEALKRLRNTEIQAYRDLYFTYKQLEIDYRDYQRDYRSSQGNAAPLPVTGSRTSVSFARFRQLFTHPRTRRATVASCTVMLAQQLCGINVLAFYSSNLFASGNESCGGQGNPPVHNRLALLYSWGFGLVNTVFALPAVKTIDDFGRRPLLLFSVSNMAWTILAAGLSFQISCDHESARIGVVAFFLFLFAAFYSPGQGPVPFVYSAESYSLSHREAGMGLSVAVNLFFAGVLTVTFPSINNALGHTGSLGLFSGLNVVALIMIFLWVPETAQKTLEELSDVFGIKTRDHMRNQVSGLPHNVHRCLCYFRGRQKEGDDPRTAEAYDLGGVPAPHATLHHDGITGDGEGPASERASPVGSTGSRSSLDSAHA